ncbi:hypothetical protein ACQ86B_17235 [Mycolicibacterium aichiense]|uniref:hypothetical protein n=1 Tax=Mycolicibacterium aichiense TaxID=1799 RepID=UPI003D66FAD1
MLMLALSAASMSAGLALTVLGSAGTASADCLSFSGLGNGHGCTTTNFGDLAIGVGKGVNATASGGFSTAIAIGGRGTYLNGPGPGTTATASGGFNTSIAVGVDAVASTKGVFDYAASYGPRAQAITVGRISSTVAAGYPVRTSGAFSTTTPTTAVAGLNSNNSFNSAIALGNGSLACANGCNPVSGSGNISLAFGDRTTAFAGPNGKFAAAVGTSRRAINGVNNNGTNP